MVHHLVNGFDPRNPVTGRPIVYEFHGCLWHGCLRCFPLNCDRYPILHSDSTTQEVYKSTLRKHELLRQHGYDLKVVWECEWDLEVKTHPDLTPLLQTLKLVDQLDP